MIIFWKMLSVVFMSNFFQSDKKKELIYDG